MMDDMIMNVNTLPEPLHRCFRSSKVRVHEEDGVVTLTPIIDTEELDANRVLLDLIATAEPDPTFERPAEIPWEVSTQREALS